MANDNSDSNGKRVRRRLDVMPARGDVTKICLKDDSMNTIHIEQCTPEILSINEELEHIIDELGIRDNPEQEHAVRIVGEHFILR